jgi:molybdate transport system substrate-binding protein
MKLPRLVAAVVAVGALAGAGCTSSTTKVVDLTPAPTTTAPVAAACSVGASAPSATKPTVSGSIRVLAAASLTEAFGDLAERFQSAHAGTKVDLSFGASSALVNQLVGGAPADVLATADTVTMGQATAARVVGASAIFTCNRLALIVRKGDPKHLRSLTDLAGNGVTYIVCAAPVPCGRFARQALAAAHVTAQPLGSEQDAKAVVAKVALGEADAGIAYVTDAGGSPSKVDAVALPAAEQIVAAYPIGVAAGAGNPSLAEAFVAYVRSAAGQRVLEAHGFQTR